MDFFDFEPNFQPYGWDRPFQKKYKTTADAIEALCELSIASAQTLTLADESGEISVVKCNPEEIEVIRPRPGKHSWRPPATSILKKCGPTEIPQSTTGTVWSVVYDLKRKQIWRVEGGIPHGSILNKTTD